MFVPLSGACSPCTVSSRSSLIKHLALQISTVVAVLLSGTAAYAQQKTLYESLGGVFAIAAVASLSNFCFPVF